MCSRPVVTFMKTQKGKRKKKHPTSTKLLGSRENIYKELQPCEAKKLFTVSILSKLQGWGHISKVDSHFRELQAKHAAYDKHLSAFVIKLPHF